MLQNMMVLRPGLNLWHDGFMGTAIHYDTDGEHCVSAQL